MDIVGTFPSIEKSTGPTVVTCVNNTLGVFPDAIKPRTYAQVCMYVRVDRFLLVLSCHRHLCSSSQGGGRGADTPTRCCEPFSDAWNRTEGWPSFVFGGGHGGGGGGDEKKAAVLAVRLLLHQDRPLCFFVETGLILCSVLQIYPCFFGVRQARPAIVSYCNHTSYHIISYGSARFFLPPVRCNNCPVASAASFYLFSPNVRHRPYCCACMRLFRGVCPLVA